MVMCFISESGAACILCEAEPATRLHTEVWDFLRIFRPICVSSAKILEAEVFCILYILFNGKLECLCGHHLFLFLTPEDSHVSSPILNAGSFLFITRSMNLVVCLVPQAPI